ncbi:MAG: patatin-like phospholipase family protein [Sphingomonas sp.]|uniref:patatin-like phospholipase family protein n=1 Tax=Sphingomonas sp. TaxID=28214 RepID=UPI003569FD1D
MLIIRGMVIGLIAMALGGCATRGALQIDCPRFANYIIKMPKSRLVEEIQADAGVGSPGIQPGIQALAAGPHTRFSLEASLAAGARNTMLPKTRLVPEAVTAAPSGDAVLLLSGGGQWGAFGVGFLDRLRNAHPDQFPRARTITGVSTGGLQALFLAVGTDQTFAALRAAYAPQRESDIVNRNPQWQAVITGSIAGLAPLKRKVLAALCVDGDPAKGCPMIDALASDASADAFIGFVDAESGDFYYAPIKMMARTLAKAEAQQCIAGAAIASAAMPVFFQQVKVGGRVYYDGGVRQSVFETTIAAQAYAEGRAAAALAQSMGMTTPPAPPTLYVVRNGPTVLTDDASPQKGADALTNALRAEAIVVNQLEVQSIADLRLANPTGPIRLVTADGFDRPPGACVKEPKEAIFSPTFMACLARFGSARADRTPPWRALTPIVSGAEPSAARLGLPPAQ